MAKSDGMITGSGPFSWLQELSRRGPVCGLALFGAALVFAPVPAGAAPPTNIQVNDADHNVDGLDNNTTQSETAHASDGMTVVVGFNDTNEFATLGVGAFTSITGFAYSIDGGATFTDAGTLAPPGGFRLYGDPALAVDGAGNFYFATMAGPSPGSGITRMAVARSTSTSPAVTFGTPVLIPGLSTSGTQDKELIAVDATGGAFDGRVYIAWTEFVPGGQNRLLFARSTSATPLAFATPIALSPTEGNFVGLNQGAMPAVAPNGDVYVVWGRFDLGGGTQELQILHSTDGGVTFLNPDPGDPAAIKTIASVTSTPGDLGSVRTRGFPYIAVDHTPSGSPTRGNLYVVFQADPDGGDPDRADILFTRSSDGGQSWSVPRSITSGAAVTVGRDPTDNDNWQPAVAVSPTTGQITVTFYDRREDTDASDGDPANTRIRVYKAVSTDAGATWLNEPVSTVAFAPSTGYDPPIAFTYMGDYNYATAVADAFDLSWGDVRNMCSPPSGASNSCSPNGRGDQDAFYARDPRLSGPDVAITPWGAVTGEAPTWQSPDIFVVDSLGMETNAAKGIINDLRGRVRNLGDAVAAGTNVRFRFAPWFAGITDAALKTIDVVSVDLAAKGDPSGDDEQVLSVNWDLTDLTDTNGGLWPAPISDFTHFCVKVDLSHPTDSNPANNLAQNNFGDVPTITGTSLVRFLIGNPFERIAEARLRQRLPEGFRARLEETQIVFDEPFRLEPQEIRLVSVRFDPPEGLGQRPPLRDMNAEIELEVDGQAVGGISVRLAAEGTVIGEPPAVFEAILRVLQEREIPVALADKERRLINSGSVPLSSRELRRLIVQEMVERVGNEGGRYLVTFHIQPLNADATQVRIEPLIIASTLSAGMLGGEPVQSNGTLERELLTAIAAELSRR